MELAHNGARRALEPPALEPYGHRPPGGGAVELRIRPDADVLSRFTRNRVNSVSFHTQTNVFRISLANINVKSLRKVIAFSREGLCFDY